MLKTHRKDLAAQLEKVKLLYKDQNFLQSR